MHALDYLLLALYLILPLLVGPWLARHVSSSADLFAAGHQSPWWLSGMSAYMTMFSSGTFVVWGGIAFKFGLVAVSICMALGLSALIVAMGIASRWRRSGVNSAAEFIHHRYGPGVVQMYTWLIMAARMMGVAVSIYSFAVIACELMPVSPDSWFANDQGMVSTEAAILVAGLAIIGYTVFGGLWSVLVTDMMQFIVLTSSVAIVVPLVLADVGGLSSFVQAAPEGFFRPVASDYTWWFLAGWVVIHAIKIGGEWAFVQRLICVPSPGDAVRGAVLFGILYLVTPIFWMTPAMVYRVREPIPAELTAELVAFYPVSDFRKLSEDEQQSIRDRRYDALSTETADEVRARSVDRLAEAAYIRACRSVAPVGLLGMMLASMFAATASMANSELNVLAGVLTNDIYRPLRGEAVSESHLVFVGRLLTVVIGLLLIATTLAVPRLGGAEKIILTITGLFVGPMVLPTIWGLFSKRIGWRATVLTILVSAAAAAWLKFGWSDHPWVRANSRLAEVIVGTVIPALVLLVCECTGGGIDPGAEVAMRLQQRAEERQAPKTLDFPLKVMAISLGTQVLAFLTVSILNPQARGILLTATVICGLLTFGVLAMIRRSSNA